MQTVLLIVAGLAFVSAFALRSMKPDNAAAAWGAFGAGVAFVIASFVVAGLAGTTDASISFVTPKDGDVVTANKPFKVDTKVVGGDLAASASDAGGHIHIYVDGSVVSMPYGPSTTIQLDPGSHELKVEYVDAQHAAFDPPVQDVISVTAERKS